MMWQRFSRGHKLVIIFIKEKHNIKEMEDSRAVIME